MNRPSRAELHAWVVGALDPGRRRDVDEEIASDPLLLAEVAAIRAALSAPWSVDDPAVEGPRWPIPPPGIGSGRQPFHARAEAGAVMGDPLAPLDRARIRLDDLPDAEHRAVVLLYRDAGRWTVLFPTAPDEQLSLAELALDRGDRILEVALRDVAGEQRFAVALPAAGHGPDWSASEPWSRLVDAVTAGEVPVTAVSFLVSGS